MATKLFKVHFTLHLRPYENDREDQTASQRKKRSQLLTLLQNRYKTVKSLRDRLLAQDAMKLAKCYFELFDYGGKNLITAAVDKRGLGITLIIETPATEHSARTRGPVPITAASLRRDINEGIFDSSHWSQSFMYSGAAIAAWLPENLNGPQDPDVILGTFEFADGDVKITGLRKMPAPFKMLPALPRVAPLAKNKFHAVSVPEVFMDRGARVRYAPY